MRVLVIVVDSLRWDALGCYGGAQSTPTIDGLAAEGARFETAIASAPWTLPSLASMLTGTGSHRLGLLQWQQPWSRAVPTLFDAFRSAGIEVASFVFDPACLFSACPEACVVGSSQDTEALLAWFAARPGGDYFAFVHYWWTHVPYLARWLPHESWHAGCREILRLLSAPDADLRGAHRAKVQGLYALAVEDWSERWLPAVLDAARANVVVVAADHGESWGERLPKGRALETVFDLHGNHLHDEVLRVPWIVHAPGRVAPGVVRGLSRTVDLAPTLAELCELGGPPLGDSGVVSAGRSVVAALGGGRVAERPAFAARNRDLIDAPRVPSAPADVYLELCCRDGEVKVLARLDGSDARSYDLAADPGERAPTSVAGDRATSLLRGLADEGHAAVAGEPSDAGLALMNEQLRALGYL